MNQYTDVIGAADKDGLSVSEAAQLLGVKRETVYAYVSRGQLTSRPIPGKRQTLLDAAEVRRFATTRRQAGRRPGGLELVIDSSVTLADPNGSLFYRGWEAAEAAASAWYEEVALWLWGLDGVPEPLELFRADEDQLGRAQLAVRAGGPALGPLDCFLLALAAAAPDDPYRYGRDASAVARRAAELTALLVEALPLVGPEPLGSSPTIVERLWARLSPRSPTDEEAEVLNSALVLLADGELDPASLAARLAASARADVYRVAGAGLSVLSGPLQGGAGDEAAQLLRRVVSNGVGEAVGEWLGRDELPPGFGHRLYREQDPRFASLTNAMEAAWPGHEAIDAARSVVAVLEEERPGSFPNADLALGVVLVAGEMTERAAEAILATARTAGFIAQGLEEYGHRLRLGGRAVYTGAEPGTARPRLSAGWL